MPVSNPTIFSANGRAALTSPSSSEENRLAGADGEAVSKCEQTDYSRLFEWFGISFGVNRTGSNVQADECPWCGKDRFYLNVESGQWDCKHCTQGGNVTTFLTRIHRQYLDRTTPEHYLALKAKRGIAWQTLKLRELAYDAKWDRWLIPFKSSEGNVVNIQLYYPNREKPNKINLPGVQLALYGFDHLAAAGKDKPVLICEGPFDAIALDYSIGAKHRDRHVIVATPGTFKKAWVEYFRGRKVRAFYDNDEGGRQHRAGVQKLLGESGVAAELKCLQWPEGTPDGYDLNDLIREPQFRDGDKVKSVLGWLTEHCYAVVRESKLVWVRGTDPDEDEQIEWVWPNRIRTSTYISFSGRRRTFKSTAMRYFVAQFTKNAPLPGCDAPSLPPSPVIYITAEDSVAKAKADLKRFGANMDLILLLGCTLNDGGQLNVLEQLPDIRQKVREFGVKLVIVDGQNSAVGAPNISTDMLARNHITNPLHQFAQKERIALVGIRNEDAEGRAYGPASMSDQSRCILRSREVESHKEMRYFELTFDITDAAPSTHPSLPFAVADLPDRPPDILWGIVPPPQMAPVKLRAFNPRCDAVPSVNGVHVDEHREGARS